MYEPDKSGYELFGQVDRALPVQVSQKRDRREQSAHEYEGIRVKAGRACNDGPRLAEMLENSVNRFDEYSRC